MSERELRKLVSEPPPRGEWEDIKVWRDRLAKARAEALADEPDVVKFLRWVRHQEKHTNPDLRWERQDALADVAGAIEAQFHVRLTETGWKWVEEQPE